MNNEEIEKRYFKGTPKHKETENKILDCIRCQDKPVEQIVYETGLSDYIVKRALLDLVKDGLVVRQKRMGGQKKFKQPSYHYVKRYDLWRDF